MAGLRRLHVTGKKKNVNQATLHNDERSKGRIYRADSERGAGQNTDHIGIIVLFGAGFSRPGILAGPKTHYGRSTKPKAPNPKAKALRRLAA